MLDFSNTALTVFAVLVAKPQIIFSPMVTVGLTVVCIIAVFMALRGERRRD
jgi:hypothetical protein